MARVQNIMLAGSPPPMRGKGGYYSEGLAEGRITPAYAGKSRGRRKGDEGR